MNIIDSLTINYCSIEKSTLYVIEVFLNLTEKVLTLRTYLKPNMICKITKELNWRNFLTLCYNFIFTFIVVKFSTHSRYGRYLHPFDGKLFSITSLASISSWFLGKYSNYSSIYWMTTLWGKDNYLAFPEIAKTNRYPNIQKILYKLL